jgi:hypothetical protein
MNWNTFKIRNGYYAMCNNRGCYEYVLKSNLKEFKKRFNLIGFVYEHDKLYCRKCYRQKEV